MSKLLPNDYAALLAEVKARVRAAQYDALRAVNKELVGLYWDIGRMIVDRQIDAAHGAAIAEQLAADLRMEFPGVNGYSRRNIFYMREFFLAYRDLPKVQPLVAQIGWTHNLIIFRRCDDPLEREFYLRMTAKFGWTKNVLIHQIENQSYEKTLLGQTNFERALIARIEDFLRAMGGRFAFVGKMQFYLAALDAQVRLKGEHASIGIILCKEKSRTIVEYALHDARKPIGVATYRTVKRLPGNLKGQLPSPEQIIKLLEDAP